MKVVDPDTTTHSISFIPRFDLDDVLVITLKNEVDKVESTPANTYSTIDGKTSINFTFTFLNNSKYQIKITELGVVIYRGKLIATDQQTQDYSLIDGRYTYNT